MATVKINYGTATAFSSASSLNSATAASYVNVGAVDNTTNLYTDYLVEIEATPSATPSGNAQIVVFAVDSVDGTNYSDSSTDANMALLGTIQVSVASTAYRSKAMSVAAAFGGTLPPKFEVVVKVDDGVALAASGNAAQYLGVNSTVA